MIDYEKHLYELDALGFTIVENLFKPELIDELKEQLKVALVDDLKLFDGLQGKKEESVLDLTTHHPVFLRALDNDGMLEIFDKLIGPKSILYSYTSTILKPGKPSAVQTMHVDTYKFIPNHVTGLVMTLPLDDFTTDNGATLYLPGSHHVQAKPLDETFSKYCLPTNRKAGDALFFNPRVWHKAGNNVTDKVRYGLTIYATRNYMKQRLDFPKMIPAESLENLAERVIEFLGYKSTPPVSMKNYYLAGEKR